MTTATAAIPLQPIALTAAGHPWPAIKNCLRMEANARIALAKLTNDENLDDLAHADYNFAVGKAEGGYTSWEDVLREDGRPQRRRDRRNHGGRPITAGPHPYRTELRPADKMSAR